VLSLGTAFALALATAHVFVPLGQNPRVILFAVSDAILVLYLSVALSVCQRRRTFGAVLAALIANLLLAASCAKLVVLGDPGRFADLLLIPDLLRVIDPVLAAGGVALLAIIAIAFLANLGRPRCAREVCLLLPLAVTGVLLIAVWNLPGAAHAAAGGIPVKGRGFPVFGHFFTAYSDFASDADWRHTVRGLRAASDITAPLTPLQSVELKATTPRNLHILVIESLTDPAWYPRFGLGGATLPPLFERWRRESRSTAVSPVFGNRSSNAEFEVLCGVPAAVGPSDVVFWRLQDDVPCLPHRLAELGYRSIALHPSPRRTFNLSVAYPALGFDRWAFAGDLDFADRDGQFLSAQSTLEQHWQRLEPLLQGNDPVLSYAFVNASHFPYERNEQRRPTRWQVEHASALTARYLNAIYYMLAAIDRFVERVRDEDPEGLIVIHGEHEPALGANFRGQRDGGLLPPTEAEPLSHATIYEVPLIVLDRGELVPLGRLPTYLLPYGLLDRLGLCVEQGCGWDTPWRLRPFRDHALLVERDGAGQKPCSVRQPIPACEETARQARAWQLELLDLIEQPTRPQGTVGSTQALRD
jgi:hypothetical protein